jgi:FKBP-type peptidyl-prolyl cis-trans isomerase
MLEKAQIRLLATWNASWLYKNIIICILRIGLSSLPLKKNKTKQKKTKQNKKKQNKTKKKKKKKKTKKKKKKQNKTNKHKHKNKRFIMSNRVISVESIVIKGPQKASKPSNKLMKMGKNKKHKFVCCAGGPRSEKH